MSSIEYISKKGLAKDLKVSKQTISGWMRRHWDKGDHYIVVGHTTLVNVSRVNDWLNSRAKRKRNSRLYFEPK